MKVVVHHWPFTGLGANQNVGHASVEVVGLSDCYVSWWPSGTDRNYKVPGQEKLPEAVQGYTSFFYSVAANRDQTYARDAEWEGAPSTKIPVGGIDGAAIKKWWDTFRRAPPAWSALDTNCAMVSAFALRAGGADKYLLGARGWWRSWNTIWSPNDVKRLAEEINRGWSKLRR